MNQESGRSQTRTASRAIRSQVQPASHESDPSVRAGAKPGTRRIRRLPDATISPQPNLHAENDRMWQSPRPLEAIFPRCSKPIAVECVNAPLFWSRPSTDREAVALEKAR